MSRAAARQDAGWAPVPFETLPGWHEDCHKPAFEAFARCAQYGATNSYRRGTCGVPFEAFAPSFAQARSTDTVTNDQARAFFEKHFRPFRIRVANGARGFVTGFYEPEVEASRVRGGRFQIPLYRRPDDLVAVTDDNRPPDLPSSFAFARRERSRLTTYHDRQAIETGALEGRGLELAWLENRVDAYFVHVQGAARLRLTDGSVMRVTYAAKSGHPFTGAGRVLIEKGELQQCDVTMDSIRAWLARHPARIDEILWHNRSFIFFRETAPGLADKGPVAAAKVQLEPGRSVAIDRTVHTFATPFLIDAPTLDTVDGKPFRRLMIAQDTGSAIVGPARGDLFIGTGVDAGTIAGAIRHPADFYALVPHAACGEFS